MAQQKSIREAVDKGHLDLTKWANNLLERLRINFITQKVWPRGWPGPYRDYYRINSKKGKGSWKSTGNGIQQMYARIYTAAGGDTERISFFFNHYLNMVDLGVGKYRKSLDVKERSENARFDRLFAKWNHGTKEHKVERGDSRRMRPFLMMEFRHQMTRLATLTENYYGEYIENALMFDLTGTYEAMPGTKQKYANHNITQINI